MRSIYLSVQQSALLIALLATPVTPDLGLRWPLPLSEVNITVAKKSGETPLLDLFAQRRWKLRRENIFTETTPDHGILVANLALKKYVASLSAKIDFDPSQQVIHPDMDLTPPEMIARRGYPVETHFVTTEDGYILEMHRLPNPNGFPTLVQHGFLGSSASWLIFGPETGLPYILWDLGYDVWLGNLRGNNINRRHKFLNPEEREFWDHSFHEMGVYDLPAKIDYILSWTRKRQLNYIGHSMGTSVFFVMGSERPEYNSKIRQMHALAPVGYLSRMRSPLKLLTLIMDGGYDSKEFMPKTDFWKHFARQYCKDGADTQWFCAEIIYTTNGRNPSQLNETMLPVIFSHFPAGVALKTALHFGQEIKTGRFCQYNYGAHGNLERYGSVEPPDYDLSKITCPLYIYFSDNDWLSHPANVARLGEKIPGCKMMYRVPERTFNHMDFAWAIDVKPLVYDIMLPILACD